MTEKQKRYIQRLKDMYGEEFVLKKDRDRKRASHIPLNQRSAEFIARRQEQNRRSSKTYYDKKKSRKAQEKVKRKDQLPVQRYSLRIRMKKQEKERMNGKEKEKEKNDRPDKMPEEKMLPVYCLRARTKRQENERKDEN